MSTPSGIVRRPRIRPRGRWGAASVLALVLLAACGGDPDVAERTAGGGEETAPPERSWAEWTALLATECPATDRPWRAALAAAAKAEAAEAFTELAARVAERHPDRWEPAWAAGESLFRQREAAAAAPHLDAAIERARRAGDGAGVACSGNRLGALAYFAGELTRAETLYREALEGAARAERPDLACFVHNNLAGLLVETGAYAEARSELELAESGLQTLGLEVPARRAAYNRGAMLLMLGDVAGARELLERLHAEAERAGDGYVLDSAALALGRVHRIDGDADSAAAWYRSVSDERPEMVARAEFGLGRLAWLQGRLDEASTLLDRAAGTAAGNDRQVELLSRMFAAEARLRSGQVEAGRRQLRELIAESDEIEAETTMWSARWLLGRWLIEQGDFAEAERTLAAAVGLLDGQSKPLNPLGDGLYFLRERADPYVDLALAVAGGSEPSDAAAAARILDIAGRAQARALQRAVGGGDVRRPVELAELQRGLAGGELLLNYLISDRGGLLLAVSSEGARAVPIAGRRELIEPLTSFRAALRAAGAAEGRGGARSGDRFAAGRELGAALLDPVADELARASRIHVVPDRDLALLPFAALPFGREGGLLGEQAEIAMLAVAGVPAPWTGSRSPVLLAGAPDLEGSGFAELAWAGYELSRLREGWGEGNSVYLGGAELTAAALEGLDLSAYPTVHLATHALASTRDPRRCGVVLSRGERMGLDRIAALELDDSLVVLSACRTGEGELLPGEGVVGLGWAFLRAGARGVVVTLWPVDDEAAARLMVAFHAGLREGLEPVAALARARREMARGGADPAVWAPFTIVLRPG